MVTIAIDTSHPVGTAALARDGVVLGDARFDSPSSHLVELSKAIERLLAESHLVMRDVDRVAVVLGPGSFTGVRIAVSFAKGLAAAGAEVVAMDSLRLLALPFLDQGRARVCAMIDAKRGEVYGALLPRDTRNLATVDTLIERYRRSGFVARLAERYLEPPPSAGIGGDPTKVPAIPF